MKAAEWVKAGRERLGLSQRGLARLLGVNNSAVAQWELSSSKPTLAHLLDMAAQFSASVGPLFGPGGDYPGELVEDPDELLLLHRWRQLAPEHRASVALMLGGAIESQRQAAVVRSVPKPRPRPRKSK
jgi:transcriptional regulator with XRE-family HTH domain